MTVELHKDPEPRPRAREVVEHIARPLPTRRQMVASARWWAQHLAQVVPWLPVLLVRELRPIFRGLGDVLHRWAVWMSAQDRHEYARAAEGNLKAREGHAAAKAATARRVISLVTVVGLAVASVWAWLVYPVWLVAAGIAVAAALDWHGRRIARQSAAPAVVLPTGPIVEGIPVSSLRASVEASFAAQGFDEITIGTPEVHEFGWLVHYHSTKPVDDDHLRQLERDLNIRRGGVTQIRDAGQAARGVLSITLADPLKDVVPSPEPDGPLTIHKPIPLGVKAGGAEWRETFLRTHFGLVGRSQSGKSSATWQIVDSLRRCPEVKLFGIDLTGGPAFGAPRRAFSDRAFDAEAAHAILDRAIRECKRRNAELRRRAEADDTPDDFEEKWHPTEDEPQWTIIIDEFSNIAATKDEKGVQFEDTLLGKVEWILRNGAKAAVTIGIASQGGTLEDFGTSVVRDQCMLKVMFACGRADVLWFFGKDARDEGFRPDLLEPANGGKINDAGKCYVKSAASNTPEMRRAYRLDQAEVRRRDRALGSRESAPAAEVVDAVEVPPVLAAVERVFVDAGRPERMPTAELLDALASHGWRLDPAALAEHLRPVGLGPRDVRWRPSPGANPVRGYYWEDVEAAVRRLV